MKFDMSAVILTMGDRPGALKESINSIRSQENVNVEIVIVWNGLVPNYSVDAETHVHSDVNIGIPAGRNLGASNTSEKIILFLDDDAQLISNDLLYRIKRLFNSDDSIAIASLRIIDEDGLTSRRHVPRLGSKSEAISGQTTGFLGGASVARKLAWDQVGGYSADLFYSMEETDLSWRILNAGWKIFYAADLQVEHPRTEPTRHSEAIYLTFRNRIWIAKANLPFILIPIYILTWLGITVARNLSSSKALLAIFKGFISGLSSSPLKRSPLSWKTVARMTKLGRPPII
ncbi:MAG: glycosyltransferase [Actinomycetota bacterium]|nr:glycosyltransferase [Actinomycetota bacterium]